jgi:hypothetical protein
MAEPGEDSTQSAEIWLEVVEDHGQPIWQACCGGHCVRTHSGLRALELLSALLVSKGIDPPSIT